MRRYLDGEIDKQYPQQKNLSELEEEARDRQREGADGREPEPATQSETDGGAAVVPPGEGQSQETLGTDDRERDQDATQDLLDAGESPECPDCGNMTLYFSEGCKTCESCGWSEC
jgi:ribonucleoside-diphosphate reductase alpha chain